MYQHLKFYFYYILNKVNILEIICCFFNITHFTGYDNCVNEPTFYGIFLEINHQRQLRSLKMVRSFETVKNVILYELGI